MPPIDYHKGAPFTVEVGCLVENGFDLGLQDYPIFDEEYRAVLNNKIIEHFWFREIGQETPQLFKMFLNRTMNEQMPYFNELYKSTLMDFDPLANVDYTTTGNRSAGHGETRDSSRNDSYSNERRESAEQTSKAVTASDARTVNSATPQMQLSGREDYATSLVDSASNGNNDSSSTAASTGGDSGQSGSTGRDQMTATDTAEYIDHVAGRQGITGAQAVQMMRDAIINVDMMVIYSLEPLFMQLWDMNVNFI